VVDVTIVIKESVSMQSNHGQEIKPNRLITQKSPYLLQHAYNPVEWYPWGNDAFEKAKSENKPVFVSIGYSTCHWCHVMEKESFEDETVAQLMNQAFVCIKVDREERPDLDAAYMAVCQSMGRNCGWPLNVIMTPDKNPFFVGSYIPKENRYGVVGMLSLVPQISQIWKTRQLEMENIGKELKQQLEPSAGKNVGNELSKADLDNAYEQLFLRFDEENGGFGRAPKFPSPHNLLFLLRYYKRTKVNVALSMVEKTLREMRLGGIFDQIGFGFHRYSTDAQWLVPHFEKMLYDQALITLAYIEAYQASGQAKFKITAKETLDFVLRDLGAPEGGFYSAQDADSENLEGKFYLWTQDEIKQALPSPNADFAFNFFDVKNEGNYYEPPKGKNGRNILHFSKPLDQLAAESNLTIDELIGILGRITSNLFKAREKRVHPAIDYKVLVDWNGLMIAALARASQVLEEPKYLQAAEKASDFILKEMLTNEGMLYHRFAKGEKAVNGFLDDYAYFIFGLIELYEAGFNEKFLLASVDLTKKMIAEFWDEDSLGFFFSKKSSDPAVPRIKQTYDGAVPSGNAVAALNLLRLSILSGEISFADYGRKTLQTFSEETKNTPLGHTFMLAVFDYDLGPTFNIVLVGEPSNQDTIKMLNALRKNYLPNLTIKVVNPKSPISQIPGMGYEKIDGRTTAYVCKDQTCMPPTNDVEKMLSYLEV
jgi:uncharacterized protein YyaL (SSP411 family)